MSARYLRGSRLKVALAIFLIVAVPVNTAIWLLSRQEIKNARSSIEAEAFGVVDKQHIMIGANFKLIVSDLIFFANYNELLDTLDNSMHKSYLLQDLSLFSRGSRLYDQIRIIDGSGMETVRVNLSKDGVPVIVPDEDLQNKGKRYYFRDSIGLNEAEVFISPFDLNIEHGEVEIPYKPMIRFAKV